MPARHYRVEYTEDDANYTLLSADEAPGPGKTAQLTGLASGTHTGKLRLTPLTGDATPVLSLPFTFQVGTLGIAEPVQAAATATATIADVMTLRDNLLAAIGVQATSASTFSGGDQLTASATVTASAADQRIMAEQLVAAVTAQASATDLQAMAEQLLVAIAGTPSVLDVQPGLTVEPLITAITAQTTAADVQAMAEHLVASATVQGTQADGLTMHDNVSAAATATATIADVKAMLESVLAAATAQATVADTYNAAAAFTTITENFNTAIAPTYSTAGAYPSNMAVTAAVQGWTIGSSGTDPGTFTAYDWFVGANIFTGAGGFSGNGLFVTGCQTQDAESNVIAYSGFKATKVWTGTFSSGTFTLKYKAATGTPTMTIKVNGVSVGALTQNGTWQTATISLTSPASITLEAECAPTANAIGNTPQIAIDSIAYS